MSLPYYVLQGGWVRGAEGGGLPDSVLPVVYMYQLLSDTGELCEN